MVNFLEYKGYKGSVQFSAEDKLLHGKILGIKSLIMYHGESLEELECDFKTGVDDYLAVCEARNMKPNIPEYEQIQINKIPIEVYLRLDYISSQTDRTIDETVRDVLQAYVGSVAP